MIVAFSSKNFDDNVDNFRDVDDDSQVCNVDDGNVLIRFSFEIKKDFVFFFLRCKKKFLSFLLFHGSVF